jgi:hypothetical protein
VFSVDTEDQAGQLLIMACERNLNNEFVARELAQEQTLENLAAFSDRLDKTAKMMNLFGDSDG